MPFFKDMVLEVPGAIAIDAYHLGRVMIWSSTVGVHHLASTLVMALVSWFHSTSSTSGQGSDWQPTALDLKCISWMLQTSLDKDVHLSALKHLYTMIPLANFDPALVVDCFNIFISCINVSQGRAVIVEGLEQLMEVSAMCFICAFHQLLVMDPTSSVIEDVRQYHRKVFPVHTDTRGLLWYWPMVRVFRLFHYYCISLDNFRLSTQYLIPIAQAAAEAAQIEYQRLQHRKVPRRILYFALCTLSMDPPPPTPTTANCLLIIAIDLGCNISSIATKPADRCVCI